MDGHLHGSSNVVDKLDVLAKANVEVGGVDVDRPRKASKILSERMLGEDQLERVARTARRCRGALGGTLGRVSTRVLPHE